MNLCLSKKKYYKEAILTAWTHETYGTVNYSGGSAQSTTAPTTNSYKDTEDIHPTTPPATSIGSIARRMCVKSTFGTNNNTPHSPGTHMIGTNTSCSYSKATTTTATSTTGSTALSLDVTSISKTNSSLVTPCLQFLSLQRFSEGVHY